ncbi:MAG: MATE family efflux transporter [Victivallales bacterium]|nr:MATE family efflux transporter [Victivallales bacterium]
MSSDYHNTLKKRFIGNREFYREVAIIVIPMIIQNTVTNIVSMLDNLMVGAIGTVPMAAVSIINYMLFVFNLCVFGGLSGPGIFATQYAGAHDDDGIRHCFRFKFITMMLMTAAATAILLIFEKPLIGCFLKGEGSPEEIAQTFDTSRKYLQIMLFGLLPFAFAMMYSSALRELGETRIPMIASVTAILVNLVFNYLLIFGKFGFPRMEAAGAAIATVLSRVVEMAIIVIYTHVKHAKYRFIEGVYRSLFIPRKLFTDICVRGTPLLFNEMCWSFGMTFLIQCYSLRGIQVIAACNIAMTFANIFNCAFFSMGAAVAVIIGHELGSNKLDTVMDTAWKLVALTVFISIVISIPICVLAPFIPRLYKTEEAVRLLATRMMWINATLSPLLAITHSSYFTIRAGGRSFLTFMMDSGYTWFVVVPVTWCIGNLTSLPILPFYFISRAADFSKFVVAIALVKSGIWIRNIVSEK